VPFKAAQIKRKGRCVRFAGKTLRVFEAQRLEGVVWKSGCFAQDAVGDWWLCVPVEVAVERSVAEKSAVGIDLGLKTTAATSDGQKLEAGRFYRASSRRSPRRSAVVIGAKPSDCTVRQRAAATTPCIDFPVN